MRLIKRIFAAIIIVILLTGNSSISFAKSTRTRLPSGTTYDYIGKRIEEYVNKNKATTAGMTVAVFDRNHTIYQGEFGYADKEKQIGVDQQTVFEWGSVSKILVWISIMQLQEEGKIDLDIDIQTYLPKDFLKNLNYNTPVTMLNLMNHNAGFQEMTTDVLLANKDDVTDFETQLKRHQPEQIYEPGTVTAYSNWGTALAGYIVECISGESYYQYVHKNIFQKLGMKHSAITPDLSDNEWVREKRKELQTYSADGKLLKNGFYYIPLYPIGMCTSTLEDLLTFAKALLPAEGKSSPLFKYEDTLNLLFIPTSYYGTTDIPLNYHGLWNVPYSVEVIGHAGNTMGCSSTLLLAPFSGTGAVVMTNQKDERIYNYTMMQSLIFGAVNQSKFLPYSKKVNGFFRPARTVMKGPMSFYYISNIDYKKKDDLFGFGVYSNDSGLEKYILASGDTFRLSPPEYIPMAALILLFAIGILYSAFTLVGGGCILTPLQRRKRRKKGMEPTKYSFRAWNYSSCGMMLLLVSNILWLGYQVYTYASSKDYLWQFGANGILGILMAISLLVLITNWRKTGDSKREKVKYIITAVFLIVAISFIIYWELYAFWRL